MSKNADAGNVQSARELWAREADEHLRYGKGFHWVESPLVMAHINEQVTGNAHLDWIAYAYQKYVENRPLRAKRILSLGCGGGSLERALCGLGFKGLIDAYDFSEGAILHARALAAQENFENIHYYVGDLNQAKFPSNTYDVVFSGSALHHILELEHLLDELQGALVERGLLIINEYVGPFKLQWTPQQTRIIDELLHLLPQQYRRRVSAPDQFKDTFGGPVSIAEMDAIDPTESVRSDEIVPLIEARFVIREEKSFGGTLLQMLLQDIVGNFNPADPIDAGFLKLLIYVETVLIREGVLKSDFVSLVAEKSHDPCAERNSKKRPIDLASELQARDLRVLHLHEQIDQLSRKAVDSATELRQKDILLRQLTETLNSARASQAGAAWQMVLRLRQWKERRLPTGSRRRKVYDALAARVRRRSTAGHEGS